MSEYDYTGNKTKNYFTAYLQKCIWWKRWNYLKKKENIRSIEKPLIEESLVDYSVSIEEVLELRYKEEILFREQDRKYPEWNELSDKRLVASLLNLCEDERLFIYQHIFEERTFKEIGYLNGVSDGKVKSTYYYAIRKIRKWMRGDR